MAGQTGWKNFRRRFGLSGDGRRLPWCGTSIWERFPLSAPAGALGQQSMRRCNVRSVVEEREAAKSSDAWQFYQWCQGEDWEKVVDQDTRALVACTEQQISLFAKPLDQLLVPLLLTGSREDEMVAPNFAERYREIQRMLPQTKIHLFEKGGHPSILTNAEQTAQLIKDFLKS